MAFKPRFSGVNHISVTVRDMERSLRFYRDLVGLKVVADLPVTERPRPEQEYRKQHKKRRTVVLDMGAGRGGPTLALIGHPGSDLLGTGILLDDVGLTHFALMVKDVKGFTKYMIDNGAQYAGPGFFVDPDGILVQFEEPGEAERILEGHRKRAAEEAKSARGAKVKAVAKSTTQAKAKGKPAGAKAKTRR